MVGVRVMVGVFVIVGVSVMVGVRDDVGVDVLVRVGDGPIVRVGVGVLDGGSVAVAVGGVPLMMKVPLAPSIHWLPIKICTSYVPGTHASDEGFHSVYPYPPVPPFHGRVSKYTSCPSRYHKAVHCAPGVI